MIRIGTAGWSLPKEWQDRFPEGDSHLERYSRTLSAIELNRTFKKTPRDSTFERWAATVPEVFRFSIKAPRTVTHDHRLVNVRGHLEEFLASTAHLGDRHGPLLIQLPPSLEFDPEGVEAFISDLRELREGPDVLEARHESWFGEEADALLADGRIGRVAADPPRAEADGTPGGFEGLAYFRLHGSPETYFSAYRDDGLEEWARRVEAAAARAEETWCIFDNTAAGEGTGDALAMKELVGSAA